MKDLISIIVPIYNVEPYLDRCIESIRNQTYQNLEIILVDDGSKDKSGIICDTYEKLDQRIVVIHKSNGGLSDARNAGLDIAKGEYIAFVDSDDYVHSKMFERLLVNLKNTDADIAICNLTYTYNTTNAYEDRNCPISEKEKIILNRASAQQLYFNNDKKVLITVAWNKLYKKYIFDNARFPKGKIHEDEFLTFQLLYQAERIVYFNEPLYYYFQKQDSIMGQFNEKRFHLFDAYLTRMKFYSNHREYELWKKMIFIYIRMTAQYMKWFQKTNSTNKKIFSNSKKKFQVLFLKNKDKVHFSFAEKAECFLFFYCTSLYYTLWKILKEYRKK